MDVSIAPPKSRATLWVLLGAAAVCGAGGLLYAFWPAPQASMVPVLVERGLLIDGVPVTATVVPRRDEVITATRGGILVSWLARSGQFVKRGDPLLKLSNAELEQQATDAETQWSSAKSDLDSLRMDVQEQASDKQLALHEAEIDLAVFEKQVSAERKLYEQGVISRISLDRTIAERDQRVARRDNARQRASQSELSSRGRIGAAVNRLTGMRARSDALRREVEGLVLRAPFDGVFSPAEIKFGASVGPGAILGEVISEQKDFDLQVSETYVDVVKLSRTVRFRNGVEAKIERISPVSQDGMIQARASSAADTSSMRNGSILSGDLVIAMHGTGLYVVFDGVDIANKTVTAVVRSDSDDSSTEVRQVSFGPRYHQRVVVLSGAEQGEQLVGIQ